LGGRYSIELNDLSLFSTARESRKPDYNVYIVLTIEGEGKIANFVRGSDAISVGWLGDSYGFQ